MTPGGLHGPSRIPARRPGAGSRSARVFHGSAGTTGCFGSGPPPSATAPACLPVEAPARQAGWRRVSRPHSLPCCTAITALLQPNLRAREESAPRARSLPAQPHRLAVTCNSGRGGQCAGPGAGPAQQHCLTGTGDCGRGRQRAGPGAGPAQQHCLAVTGDRGRGGQRPWQRAGPAQPHSLARRHLRPQQGGAARRARSWTRPATPPRRHRLHPGGAGGGGALQHFLV